MLKAVRGTKLLGNADLLPMLLHCSSTPGTLSTAGFLLIVAAASSVYASNGDGVVDAAAFLLAISGVAAFIGGR